MIVNQRVISTICNVSIPAGTAISVLSPTFFPSKPLAIGEFTDIFPVFRSASLSGTICLLYTSDAADDLLCVDLGGRRIIKKKKNKNTINYKNY